MDDDDPRPIPPPPQDSDDRPIPPPPRPSLDDDDSGSWMDIGRNALRAGVGTAMGAVVPGSQFLLSPNASKRKREDFVKTPIMDDHTFTGIDLTKNLVARGVDEAAQVMENTGLSDIVPDVVSNLARPKAFVSTLLHGNAVERARKDQQNSDMWASQGQTVDRTMPNGQTKPWLGLNADDIPIDSGLGTGAQAILAQDWKAAHPNQPPTDLNGELFGHPLQRVADAASAFIHPDQAQSDDQIEKYAPLGNSNLATRDSYFSQGPKLSNLYAEKGDIDWPEAALHVADFGKKTFIAGQEDPLMYIHPGMSAEGEALQAARTGAISDAMQSGLGKYVSPEAAQDFARPTLESSVKAGHVGIGLKIPFIGQDLGFIPVPKAMAPIAKALEPVFKQAMQVIAGPEARSVNQLMQKAAEGPMRAEVNNWFRTSYVPKMNEISELVGARGVTPEMSQVAQDLSEVLDDEHNLRAHDSTLEGINDVGLPIQQNVPGSLRSGLDALIKDRPDLKDQAEEFFKSGAAHLQPQARAAFVKASAMDARQQATVYAMARMAKELGDESREVMARNGVDIPELNSDIKLRPKQLFEAIDAIKQRSGESQGAFGRSNSGPGVRPATFRPSDGGMATAEMEQLRENPDAWNALHRKYEHDPFFDTIGQPDDEPFVDPKDVSPVRDDRPFAGTPRPPASKRLLDLAEQAKQGTISAKGMNDLVQEIKADKWNTPLGDLKTALENQVPLALKQYNGVPSYVPGVVSADAKSVMDAAESVAQRSKKGGIDGPKPENKVRSSYVRKLNSDFQDMGDVKQSVAESSKFHGAGTASTSGQSVLDMQAANENNWWGRFLTKTGIKELPGIKEQIAAASPTFMSNDPFEKIARQMQGPNLKAMTNAQMDRMVQNLYDKIPAELPTKIRSAVYDGIDTGRTAPQTPFKFRDPDYSRETPNEYNAAKANAEKIYDRFNKPVPVMRPATMEDLEQIWKDGGRTDTFAENMSPEELKAVQAGKDLKQAITERWQPFGRDMLKTGEEGPEAGYVHSQVVRDLQDYKALGQDPDQIARLMRTSAPVYTALTRLQKKWSTVYGTQFPGYMLMKQIHDLARGHIGDLWDAAAPSEIVGGQVGHFDYAQTGAVDSFPAYNNGSRMVGGAEAVQILEQNNIISRNAEVGSGFDASPAQTNGVVTQAKNAASNTIDATAEAGRTLENVIRAQDNANRSAAFFARLRSGDTPLEAQLHVNKALFDFTRRSPATAFLSSTGIIPFASWHAKVLPFMASWAFENPGEFMVVQKALQAAGAGEIPMSQLPNNLRDKTNIVTSVKQDDQGHTQLKMMSDTGLIPGNELMHLARSIQQNGGRGWLKSHFGWAFRGLFAANDQLQRDAKDPEAATGGEQLGAILKAAAGRPAMIGSTLLDKKKSIGDKITAMINPMMSEDVDLTRQGRASLGEAKGNIQKSQRIIADANRDVEEARKAFVAAHKNWAQADALKMSDDDPIVQSAIQDVIKAQTTLARKQADQQKRIKDLGTAQKYADTINLAP